VRGLDVWLPLGEAAFDAACAEGQAASALRLATLLPRARAALVVGSAGRGFFDAFAGSREAADGRPDPLDRYTRAVVGEAARTALEPLAVAHAEGYPFLGEPAAAGGPIPFQRLGRAAGLGGPGPLGLQIHPTFGAWWAYRALVVVDAALPPATALGDGCAGCPAPCVAACPGHAVSPPGSGRGFDVGACHAHRLSWAPCETSCSARLACLRGPEHRYTEAQLAFHMRASMPRRAPSAPR
jgi:epoxyqueuosine reductase